MTREVIQKTLDNTNVKEAREAATDLKVFGDGDRWVLLCKASSQVQGWMKSTKVCNVPGGCVMQATTQQRNPDGSYALAEALTYIPGVSIGEDGEGNRILARD